MTQNTNVERNSSVGKWYLKLAGFVLSRLETTLAHQFKKSFWSEDCCVVGTAQCYLLMYDITQHSVQTVSIRCSDYKHAVPFQNPPCFQERRHWVPEVLEQFTHYNAIKLTVIEWQVLGISTGQLGRPHLFKPVKIYIYTPHFTRRQLLYFLMPQSFFTNATYVQYHSSVEILFNKINPSHRVKYNILENSSNINYELISDFVPYLLGLQKHGLVYID